MNERIAAFPEHFSDGEAMDCDPGMDLRDWFAGMALIGILAGQHTAFAGNPERVVNEKDVAVLAYEQADAMIKARGEVKHED